MCGITGFIQSPSVGAEGLKAQALDMAKALQHRGPDSFGVWVDAECGLALAHRRLAILDLSENGAQPMLSVSGRWVLNYNGEIYNHRALRAALQAAGAQIQWRGHSDTEVMLAAIEHWGLDQALRRFVGMFAFALWDRQERRLHLARDRFGEKPLYYSVAGRALLFGSELGALQRYSGWRGTVDRDALTLLLRLKSIPAPFSIYRDVRKLPPASLISFEVGDAAKTSLSYPEPRCYWDLQATIDRSLNNRFAGTRLEAVDALDELLRSAVKERMEADVPLGAFLSGGVDSSTIVALMQAQSSRPIKTFTVGFDEQIYNEAPYASAVAQHLGTDHSNLYVSSADVLAVIPQLPTIYDEPFADSAQVPSFLVSKFARQHVTVSLSGDGGDELFGGYNRYLLAPNLRRAIRYLPRASRKLLARAVAGVSPRHWDALFNTLGKALPLRHRLPMAGDLLHKGAAMLSTEDVSQLYLNLISQWKSPAGVVIGSHEPDTTVQQLAQWAATLDWQHGMMALDTAWYLPSDVLVQLDRASMAVSLESRVPFLDPSVFEFAWRLPLNYKLHDGQGKWPLRQVLYKYVPRELIDRPKMGFGMPIDVWLRGPLREWAESLLSETRLNREGFFNSSEIRLKWAQHLNHTHNWHYELWNVLMFQQWHEAHAQLPVAQVA
jgi:asparagine synthase (glutamine-hydrolysing)